MSLAKHVNGASIMEAAKDHPHLDILHKAGGRKEHTRSHHSGAHAGRYRTEPMPKYSIPKTGIDPDVAYQLITDELELDGRPTLNLASFVHTFMPKQADKLIMENISKNLIDSSEYEQTQVIHARCLSILADLWHAPKSTDADGNPLGAVGTATTGSSEAIMLGVLAMKKRWQLKRKAEGKSWKEPGPNLVFGANAQVAIEKASRYQDIEERLVPVSKESNYALDHKRAMEYVDENTIGVIVILGSTYTGQFECAKEMCELLDEYEAKTGISIPVHIDAASGGFTAPFSNPSLKWDFQLDRVASINTSGHKFGAVYAGLGWIIYRSQDYLPKELVFELHYLGSIEYTFSINFSRPAAPVLAQYFNFINLGFDGYRDIIIADLKNARLLSRALEMSGYYEVVSNIHKPAPKPKSILSEALGGADTTDAEEYVAGLPVVAFKFSDELQKAHPKIEQRWIQTLLRAKGWIVPNYELPPDCSNIEILRVVVRENFSEDMVDKLFLDIMEVTESLLDDTSAAAHLANVTSKVKDTKTVAGQTSAQGKHKAAHAHKVRDAGVKATGFSAPC